jgi:ABC-2 type transport system ATP-binding protein
LANVDLRVGQGEIAALVGPNGAGKTTLLKILATLILPDAGEARVLGRSVIAEPGWAKARIGLLCADERSFYPRLTGRENLAFFAALHGLSSSAAAMMVERAAAAVPAQALAAPYQELSTGTKQKLALARCLLGAPRVLLLDEPTRSLDPAAAEAVREAVRGAVRGGAVDAALFTTHQDAEARGLADRVFRLEAGKVSE